MTLLQGVIFGSGLSSLGLFDGKDILVKGMAMVEGETGVSIEPVEIVVFGGRRVLSLSIDEGFLFSEGEARLGGYR
eukprot:CAMPEP_0172485504 /NCGR_PEP_ID=MMETSP1066-20121228/13548_1 /TAXON_ID=671091 /ORGANISM="Coscinodiscus wailesii, Strain CCMP2513" /LENGTH=75 /DNA_ID=CAMNT_0013250803 /DNA_START=271 /DNA_END=498 /DNA_ORIENTATION=-